MIERFAQMPSALRANARWERLGDTAIPAMLVHPDWERGGAGSSVPVILWMHGRTAHKELDPGRYLRWMRAGMGVCAVDLPGHGERADPHLQDAAHTLQVVQKMVEEIDPVVAALQGIDGFDSSRIGIGGMSAGGMAALARLARPHPPHPFRAASVEATTGNWREHYRDRLHQLEDEAARGLRDLDPLAHLEHWREMPFQAIHTRGDQWISFDAQAAFIESLRQRYKDPSLIDFVAYENTGAPAEHIGFGRLAADAKDRQRDFFSRWLLS